MYERTLKLKFKNIINYIELLNIKNFKAKKESNNNKNRSFS